MTVDLAISAFGAKAKDKLTSPAAAGQPEDQLRAPFERLLGDVAEIANFQPGAVVAVGESSDRELKTRPDYAVTVGEAALVVTRCLQLDEADERVLHGAEPALHRWKRIYSLAGR